MIIDGNALAKKFYTEIKNEIDILRSQNKRAPHLSVILVGQNPSSQIYVNLKQKRSLECGMQFSLFRFEESISEQEIISKIIEINNSSDIDGLLVQLPLPKKFNENKIINSILPVKDLDGIHPINMGKLLKNEDALISCTPAGVMELIKSTGVKLAGLNAVVIGRSNIVGKPIAILLLKENCTVTICHSKTQHLDKIIKKCDIVVAAIGQPAMIKGAWIKKGALVIDVGINRREDKNKPKGYRIEGDVEYDKAFKRASYITPVPGGVGPMTIAMLLKNTLKVYKEFNYK